MQAQRSSVARDEANCTEEFLPDVGKELLNFCPPRPVFPLCFATQPLLLPLRCRSYEVEGAEFSLVLLAARALLFFDRSLRLPNSSSFSGLLRWYVNLPRFLRRRLFFHANLFPSNFTQTAN